MIKMKFSIRLQLLTSLVLYASCAQAIMVKFGTSDGPITPPPPVSTLPPPQPYRTPAPVWEERSNDSPDPNAQWRPQLFIPQPRYTHVVYNTVEATPHQPLSNAQQFVNYYRPNQIQPRQPILAPRITNYFTPAQVLSSQSLPGFGIRYFVPAYVNDLQERKNKFRQEDAKQNQIETNEVNKDSRESANDALWKFEKDAVKRNARHTPLASPIPYQQRAVYVPLPY